MPRVFTIGHAQHSLERFFELLDQHAIEVVVDVRSQPYSRHAPHFSKRPLQQALAAHQVLYVFRGQQLGGRPGGADYYDEDGNLRVNRIVARPDFAESLGELIELTREHEVAILCAEEDPRRCHRHWLLSPLLKTAGGAGLATSGERVEVTVQHIRGDGRLQSEQEVRRARRRGRQS